jgi:hypothetical protein
MKPKSILFTAFISLTISKAFSQVSAPSMETAFQNYIRSSQGSVGNASVLPSFRIKEDTKGNRYLYDKWVSGSVTGVDGVVYNSPNFHYNYDKISQKLFMLLDSNKVLELSSGNIAGFNLKGDTNEYQFERLKNSTDLNFYQPVYKNEKGYSLYKLLVTKFKRADYQTNGIIESGNKYDEYVDEVEYFIASPKQEISKITFKKKNLEKALERESAKVDTFFSLNRAKVDEDFVTKLLQSINAQL